MSKVSKPFKFTYTLKKKDVRDLKLIIETLELTVIGQGYRREGDEEGYTEDIEAILFEGSDIKPVIDFAGMLEDFKEAALRYVQFQFMNEKEEVPA